MNFIDPSDFQNLTSDLLAGIKLFTGNVALNNFCINHEKMALT